MKTELLIALVAASTLLGGCAPKIYVIDRQTVLEQEAAGQWPEFDKDLLGASAEAGPTPLESVKPSAHRERLYNVLNGELADESALGASVKK